MGWPERCVFEKRWGGVARGRQAPVGRRARGGGLTRCVAVWANAALLVIVPLHDGGPALVS